MTVTVHYLSAKMKMVSRVLNTVKIDEVGLKDADLNDLNVVHP